MALFTADSLKELKKRSERRDRIKALLEKYPEPWVIEKEPHNYKDGTSEFTHVRYYHKPAYAKGEEMCVEIGSHVTPDLAELLILLREAAMDY